ncbi:hypothetical protein NO995_06345 [Aestuariibaculum sp. M13]|uniref:hypothetical protein n=1 Tax=Aestuariibaculum sp. M13 TaxID=2967132 RepID=UPI002159CCED|nr:hypothetical protein [Aestuariibaculum sp. M13]MCR8667292.1 hypothetical protein [Aestuariibaculum sp. M13]
MNHKQLAELLEYASPFSILVVTYKDEIVELRCPFKVVVINHVGELLKGDLATVEMVKIATNMKTVYVIDGKLYYYYHFNILV